MSKLVWSRDYEIGIEVIDHQHERIVSYINEVYDANKALGCEESKAQLTTVLHNLVDYTVSHFAFEEALLEEIDYSELMEHKLTHENFIRLVGGLKQRFDDGEKVADELAAVLQNWLIKHIMTDDLSYSEEVKAKLLG